MELSSMNHLKESTSQHVECGTEMLLVDHNEDFLPACLSSEYN